MLLYYPHPNPLPEGEGALGDHFTVPSPSGRGQGEGAVVLRLLPTEEFCTVSPRLVEGLSIAGSVRWWDRVSTT